MPTRLTLPRVGVNSPMSRSSSKSRSWTQLWHDWLEHLPLADHTAEPEIGAETFVGSPRSESLRKHATAAERSPNPHASDPPESPSTSDARPPTA